MKKKFRSFKEARKFSHSLKLKNWKEWIEFTKSGNKPKNIPSSPNGVYQNEWKGTGDWLGTGAIANKYKSFRSFIDARKFVNNLGIKNQREWKTYSKSGKKPHDIPSDPQTHFKNKGWISWGDWLGSGTVDPQELSKNFLVFSKARKIIRSKNFKSGRDWKNYTKDSKFPKDIPIPLLLFVIIVVGTLVIGIPLYYQIDLYYEITHDENIQVSLVIGFAISFVVVLVTFRKLQKHLVNSTKTKDGKEWVIG